MVNLSAPTMVSSDVGWAIGTSLAVAAQFVGNLGTVLQRRSHIESGSKPVLSRPLWIFGLSLIILASVSDFVALNFTSEWLGRLRRLGSNPRARSGRPRAVASRGVSMNRAAAGPGGAGRLV